MKTHTHNYIWCDGEQECSVCGCGIPQKSESAPGGGQHTPTPWIAVLSCGRTDWLVADCGSRAGSGKPIARIENYHGCDKANAQFIVRAVNSHAALLEALREVMRCCVTVSGVPEVEQQKAMGLAFAAIAQAEGRVN